MDETLQGTLTGTKVNTKGKGMLRQSIVDMMQRRRDPGFVKYAHYAMGYDPGEIEKELGYYTQYTTGQPTASPSTVQVGGRTHEIKSLADEKAYSEMTAKTKEEEMLKNTAKEDFQLKLTRVNEAMQDIEGLKSAVGSGVLGRGVKLGDIYTDPKRSRFVGTVQQVIDTDALDTLIEAKAKGATFGALSDSEMMLLKSAATKLGNWQIIDKDTGKVKGYNASEEDFLKELNNLKALTEKAFSKLETPSETPQGPTQRRAPWSPEEDQQALEWAKANPNDPRAKQVYDFLGQPAETGGIQSPSIPSPTPDQSPTAQTSQKNEKPLAKKIGDFLGISKFAEGIGTAMFLKTKEGKKLQEDAERGDKYAIEALQQILEDAPNAKELIGSAGMTALNIGSGGLASKGVSLAGRVAQGAATGYGFDVASNLQEKDKTVTEAIKPGLGTVVAGAIPILGTVKNAFAKGGKNVAERVMNSVVKPSIDDLEKSILYNGKTLGKEMLDEGLRGTKKSILRKASAGLTENEEKLQQVLKDSTATIKKEELLPYLSKLKDRLLKTPTARAQKALQNIDEAIKLFPDEFNLSTGNELKRNLYSELRDLAYKIDPNLTPTAESSKALASGLKDLIEKKASSPEVSAINKKIAMFMKTQEGMLDQLARTQRNNLAGVGTIGSMIEKVLGTTAIKTYGAAIIDKASKILEKQGSGKGGQLTKTIILNAIEKAKRD